MKTLSLLLIAGFLFVSCENKTQQNEIEVYEDSILLEDTYQETPLSTDNLNTVDSATYEMDSLNMRVE